jgi:hypothetical protein
MRPSPTYPYATADEEYNLAWQALPAYRGSVYHGYLHRSGYSAHGVLGRPGHKTPRRPNQICKKVCKSAIS